MSVAWPGNAVETEVVLLANRDRDGTLAGEFSDKNVQATGIPPSEHGYPLCDTDEASRRFGVPPSSITRDVIDEPSLMLSTTSLTLDV